MFSLVHCLLECGNYQMGRQDDVGVERIVFEMKNIRVHISISLFTVTQSTFLDPSKSQFLQLSGGKWILWELNYHIFKAADTVTGAQ